MTFLPSVVRAEHRDGFRIHLTFNDNAERTVDFRQWLQGPVFEPLKDPAYFRKFFVDGGTVVWPNGADIAPETLYAAAASRRRPDQSLQPTKARARNEKPSRLRRRG
jgi:hypothetical protein